MRWLFLFCGVGAAALCGCGQPFTTTTADSGGADAGSTEASPPLDAGQDGPSNSGCPGANLATDPANCGACTHSCRDRSCTDGICAPVVLTPNLTNPRELAVARPGSIYITVGGACDGTGDCKNGVLEHVAITAGGGTMVTVVDPGPNDQIAAVAVAPNADDVFYSTAPAVGGQIYRYVPGDGGTRLLFVNQQQAPIALTVDGTYLYWANAVGGSIWAADLAVPSPVLQQNDNLGKVPSAITTDPQSHTVFWANSHDDPNAGPKAINGSLHEVTGATSPGPDYPLYQAVAVPTGIAFIGGSLFWTESVTGNIGTGTPVDGKMTPKTLATNQAAPYRVAAEPAAVYWTNIGDGTVMKLVLGGSDPPFALATGQNAPTAIGVDDTTVYWLNRGTNNQPDGALMGVPK
jgi:hypothetical protein